FLGRLSNFINAELYGRVTDLPWGMVFPRSDGLPRHPSQLYEAGLEGLALGIVMFVGWRRGWLGNTGTMTAILLIGYGLAHLGLVLGIATMGQILCLPMLAAGGWILWRRRAA
ncbi:MAG: prolipoprotein diacylglyceryl transferase family protein, partial [Candidatus Puniceispirillaceae bacterium]